MARQGIRRVVVLAALALLAGASQAYATVTHSAVTSPADLSYFQENNDNQADPAHQISVTGTSDGTTGDTVDLVCTYGQSSGTPTSTTVKASVSVSASGTFSYSGPAPGIEEPCVLRAIPMGNTSLPADLTPYRGPRIASGDFNTDKLTSGPNSGLTYDFYDNAAQFAGDGDYESLGGGGMFDAYPVDPGTFVEGGDLFYANNYTSSKNSDRSDMIIDGQPAYAAYTAESLFAGSSALAGLPAVSFSSSQDPTTGDLLIFESEPLVKCAPDASTYPATPASCTSFVSTGVRFDRVIEQTQSGRQARLFDRYTSTDNASHPLDVRYGQDFQNATAAFRFPWVDGASYRTHASGDTVAPPPSAPSSFFVSFDNTLADGDQNGAQGAITLSDPPHAMAFVPGGRAGLTHLDLDYQRTVPAGGSVSLRTTYSWAFTKSDAGALASLAERQMTAPGAVTYGAPAIGRTSAVVAALVTPNGQDTSYHIDYGTTPAYGSSTPSASAGSGFSPQYFRVLLSNLKPGTTYHYRVVASNASGVSYGHDIAFRTHPVPAGVKVGRVRRRGANALVTLTCQASAPARCRGSIRETIRVRVPRGRRGFRRVTRVIGSVGYNLTAGSTRTITVRPNRYGRGAIAHAHRLRLTVTLTVRLGRTGIASRRITLIG